MWHMTAPYHLRHIWLTLVYMPVIGIFIFLVVRRHSKYPPATLSIFLPPLCCVLLPGAFTQIIRLIGSWPHRLQSLGFTPRQATQCRTYALNGALHGPPNAEVLVTVARLGGDGEGTARMRGGTPARILAVNSL
ncbi:hypothetical protein RSAG8_02716, partial [Rhizoctonia solani AG-8 WAC10335]